MANKKNFFLFVILPCEAIKKYLLLNMIRAKMSVASTYLHFRVKQDAFFP